MQIYVIITYEEEASTNFMSIVWMEVKVIRDWLTVDTRSAGDRIGVQSATITCPLSEGLFVLIAGLTKYPDTCIGCNITTTFMCKSFVGRNTLVGPMPPIRCGWCNRHLFRLQPHKDCTGMCKSILGGNTLGQCRLCLVEKSISRAHQGYGWYNIPSLSTLLPSPFHQRNLVVVEYNGTGRFDIWSWPHFLLSLPMIASLCCGLFYQ